MPDLRRVKVGDGVYVVPQNKSESPFTSVVVKVGTKYGYIKRYRWSDDPFHLKDGRSHHKPNHNARANHYGFDVFSSKAEYDAMIASNAEAERLRQRLLSKSPYDRRLADIPVELVTELHAVLDRHGFNVIAQRQTTSD